MSTKPSLATSLFRNNMPRTNSSLSWQGIFFSSCLLSSYIPCYLHTHYMLMQKIHIIWASRVYRGIVNPMMLWYDEHICRRNYLIQKVTKDIFPSFFVWLVGWLIFLFFLTLGIHFSLARDVRLFLQTITYMLVIQICKKS